MQYIIGAVGSATGGAVGGLLTKNGLENAGERLARAVETAADEASKAHCIAIRDAAGDLAGAVVNGCDRVGGSMVQSAGVLGGSVVAASQIHALHIGSVLTQSTRLLSGTLSATTLLAVREVTAAMTRGLDEGIRVFHAHAQELEHEAKEFNRNVKRFPQVLGVILGVFHVLAAVVAATILSYAINPPLITAARSAFVLWLTEPVLNIIHVLLLAAGVFGAILAVQRTKEYERDLLVGQLVALRNRVEQQRNREDIDGLLKRGTRRPAAVLTCFDVGPLRFLPHPRLLKTFGNGNHGKELVSVRK